MEKLFSYLLDHHPSRQRLNKLYNAQSKIVNPLIQIDLLSHCNPLILNSAFCILHFCPLLSLILDDPDEGLGIQAGTAHQDSIDIWLTH